MGVVIIVKGQSDDRQTVFPMMNVNTLLRLQRGKSFAIYLPGRSFQNSPTEGFTSLQSRHSIECYDETT